MRTLSTFALLTSWAFSAVADGNVGPTRDAFVPTQDPLGEPVTNVVYLAQNWSPGQSIQFYFTEQGSRILPYDWFLALEQADTATPFRDNQHILKYRYLPQNPGSMNPDGLPVGFVAGGELGRRWLGMTCAACHTAEIHLGTTGYRIDGAPTLGDVQGLLTALTAALQQTQIDPAKFGRFARAVLGANNTPANQAELQIQLATVIKARIGYNLRNFAGYDPGQIPPPPPTHFARLDAVGAIANEVYYHAVNAANLTSPIEGAVLADAPVSYPFLWDTAQHDFVQWLGIAKNGGALDILTLSRNVGEVLGVFADFAIPENPSILSLGYSSTVKIQELGDLENLVKTLWSPLWPDDFPKIDRNAAAKGAQLYQANCVSCHVLIDRTNPNRTITAIMNDSGTDPRASSNFFNRTGSSGKLSGVNVNFVPFTAKIPPVADADSMLTNVVIGVILGRFRPAPPDELAHANFRGARTTGVALARVQQSFRYKARPLNGIWATAPYLHNGSVPNLDALLQPAAKRPSTFSIGVRTFDPARVGYLTDVPSFPKFSVNNPDGSPITGNSNAGHEFGASLSDVERGQLIEYLKTL
ncbi:MAG: di-heme-cytochrome C peroxidase [Isosphaerales bacterium]